MRNQYEANKQTYFEDVVVAYTDFSQDFDRLTTEY